MSRTPLYLIFVLLIPIFVLAQDWTSLHSGTDQKLHSIYFLTQRAGWAVGGEGIGIPGAHPVILKTEDGGENWTVQPIPSSVSRTAVIEDICFASSNVGWAVSSADTILKTVNGGDSWTVQTAPRNSAPLLYGVVCLDEETAIAVGSPGYRVGEGVYGNILKTSNGETWRVVHSSDDVLADVYFKDDAEGWAVGGNSILKTNNGGETWTSRETVADSGLADMTCRDDTCWIAGWGENLFRKIGAGTWTAVDTNQLGLFTGMEWKNSTLGILTGENRILESSDGGITWNLASTDISSGIGLLPVAWMYEVACKSGICWAVGSDGTILRRGEPGPTARFIPPNVTLHMPNETGEEPRQPRQCPAIIDDCEAGWNPIFNYDADGCAVNYTCLHASEPRYRAQLANGRVRAVSQGSTCEENHDSCANQVVVTLNDCMVEILGTACDMSTAESTRACQEAFDSCAPAYQEGLHSCTMEYEGCASNPQPPRCSDSDGGNDIYTQGVLQVYTPSYGELRVIEQCSNEQEMQELVCVDDDPVYAYTTVRISCPENYACQEGACVLAALNLQTDLSPFLSHVPGLGKSERITINLLQKDGSSQSWGVYLDDNKVTKIVPQEIEKGTLRVSATQETLDRIIAAENPGAQALAALKSGEIHIEGQTIGKKIKVGLFNLALRWGLLG